jgi:hypothetical protein
MTLSECGFLARFPSVRFWTVTDGRFTDGCDLPFPEVQRWASADRHTLTDKIQTALSPSPRHRDRRCPTPGPVGIVGLVGEVNT